METEYFEQGVRLEQVLEEDGQLVLSGLPFRRGQRIDVTLLPKTGAMERRFATAKEWRASGLIGVWKDRTDIEDGTEFADRLRERLQKPRHFTDDPNRQ